MSTITGFDNKTNGWNKAIVQMMGGVDIADAFLRGEYVLTAVAKVTQKFLELIGKVTIDTTWSIDFDEFFTTRAGLWVEDNFKVHFVDSNTKVAGASSLSKYKIKKVAYDHQISKELPEDYVFEADEACHAVSALISKQWGGKVGSLLNNGHANIFYVRSKDKKKVFTVRIYWGSVASEWRVTVWELDVGCWDAGFMVFSRS